MHLQRGLPAIIRRDVAIGAEIPRPAASFQPSRNQYLGTALLAELKRHDVPDADRIVGLIDADVYAPGLNFIFGQAEKPGRFAIVALPRFRESFRGRPEDVRKFHDRALKVTIHELGHTFGSVHCRDRKCVMHFANSLPEVDHTGFQYCSREEVPE